MKFSNNLLIQTGVIIVKHILFQPSPVTLTLDLYKTKMNGSLCSVRSDTYQVCEVWKQFTDSN